MWKNFKLYDIQRSVGHLGVTYIRITQVKASKIDVLVSQYKMFEMEERETIKDFL